MAPRSIWNGTVAFGLVKVPIKLYSATTSRTIRFREVHLADGAPLDHRRVCTADDEIVEYGEIVKGYEVAKGEYLVLDPDEVKAAAGDRGKLIELDEFVDAERIDPIFFARTYYAGFRDDPEPFVLLQRALGRCGRAGIGRFTFHNREYLVAVRGHEDVLAVHTLRFADEVVTGDGLKLPASKRKPAKKEVAMAEALISGLHADFDAGEFADEHRQEVMKLIEAKAKGEAPKKRRRRPKREPDDLTDALEKSLAAQKGSQGAKAAKGSKGKRKKAKA